MSNSNGVIRVGRKGRKKFAFGEEGPDEKVFEIDIVDTWQEWVIIDDEIRPEEDENGERKIPVCDVPVYYERARGFVKDISQRALGGDATGVDVTTGEALDFLARLHEQFDELAGFFRPKLLKGQESPDTSETELRFSVEPSEPAKETSKSS